MTPYLEDAMWRYPGLEGVGLRTFFCGPESFTPDVHPLLGPAPEVDGVFVAAGMNSLGILSGGGAGSIVAQWIVDGRAPVDVTHYSVERALPYETTRRFRGERVVESLGVLAYEQLVDDLGALTRTGTVHADLSPYNLLWWRDRLWMIDFPQAVDLLQNPHGFDLLHHDVITMTTWFTRKGVPCDGEALFAELLAEAF